MTRQFLIILDRCKSLVESVALTHTIDHTFDHVLKISNRRSTFNPPLSSQAVSLSQKSTNVHQSLWTCVLEACIEHCRIVWDVFEPSTSTTDQSNDSMDHILGVAINSHAGVIPLIGWLSNEGGAKYVCDVNEFCNCLASMNAQLMINDYYCDSYSLLNSVKSAFQVIVAQSSPHTRDDTYTVLVHTSPATSGEHAIAELMRYTCTLCESHRVTHDISLVLVLWCSAEQAQHAAAFSTSRQPHMVTRTACNTCACHVHCMVVPPGGTHVDTYIDEVLLAHHRLQLATITGIPMKEEQQNCSTSHNYDVRLVYSDRSATWCEGAHTRLRWCTPRHSSALYSPHDTVPMARATLPVTPLSVTSRPTACLVNFLLASNRTVLLENSSSTPDTGMALRQRVCGGAAGAHSSNQRPPGAGTGGYISHLLCAHSGVIYLHVLHTYRGGERAAHLSASVRPLFPRGWMGVTAPPITHLHVRMVSALVRALRAELPPMLPPVGTRDTRGDTQQYVHAVARCWCVLGRAIADHAEVPALFEQLLAQYAPRVCAGSAVQTHRCLAIMRRLRALCEAAAFQALVECVCETFDVTPSTLLADGHAEEVVGVDCGAAEECLAPSTDLADPFTRAGAGTQVVLESPDSPVATDDTLSLLELCRRAAVTAQSAGARRQFAGRVKPNFCLYACLAANTPAAVEIIK